MNMQQAGERAEVVLDEALAGIKPPLKWEYGTPGEIACGDELNRATGGSNVKRSRVITTTVTKERRGSLFGLVQRHWEAEGYTITSVNADAKFPDVFAETSDGFVVSMNVGATGNVWFDVSSPCATASDVTYPAGTPGASGGPKTEEVTPTHHSSFWSSSEPLPQ
ncbi:hypothetical protein QCN29_21415 [Streptomyces sp. HNM0663]|uniref:Uncharacterized protein n=1 Tax=Streptomyces chengmaiensis TaxID=3040919 RepID=A0ABT6HTV8_9ACTN|nr:hypothetical protein [Streptomyces chengmaiensis]MDH2391294.1 hypothetical protein [Streptomyces chengmaiensis]